LIYPGKAVAISMADRRRCKLGCNPRRCIVSHMSVALRELKKTYVAPDGAAVPVIDVPEFRLTDGEQVGLVGGERNGENHAAASDRRTPDSGSIYFDAADAGPAGFNPGGGKTPGRI
jgi:hypothetical protein